MRSGSSTPATAGLVALLWLVAAVPAAGAPSRTAAVELANPAAVFCAEQGGQYQPHDGASARCLLPDGRDVDAWEHFRAHHSNEAAPGLPNPAAVYCTDQGGSYDIRTGADGEFGVCTLPDGREIDAWQYFREQHSERWLPTRPRAAAPGPEGRPSTSRS